MFTIQSLAEHLSCARHTGYVLLQRPAQDNVEGKKGGH